MSDALRPAPAGESAPTACDCLECRIRAACGFPAPMELSEPINALCSVLAECLAHYPTAKAKQATRLVLDLRLQWMQHPRVAVQQTPAGRA